MEPNIVDRLATDKTVTRRYDLTRDDRLRNFAEAERITPTATCRLPDWAFEGSCASTTYQKQLPVALRRSTPPAARRPILGGKVELRRTACILRIDGQDTQRAFASGAGPSPTDAREARR